MLRVSQAFILLGAMVAATSSCDGQTSQQRKQDRPLESAERRQRADTWCSVTRIVDGDSFECGDAGRVRMIGIDAPELNQRPFGNQSRDVLAALIPVGRDIRLEFDVRPTDPYGRLLAYVWDGKTLVNEDMVQRGWAMAERFPPNVRLQSRLNEAQQRARDARSGLWASGGFDCKPGDRRRRNC